MTSTPTHEAAMASAPTGDDIEAVAARMARVGMCRSPSFAPDGTRLAFVSDLSGVPQVWTVDAEGGWPEQVTALDDQVGNVAWSPDEEWLAFSLAPGGGLNSQIYVVRPDGTGLRRLSAGSPGARVAPALCRLLRFIARVRYSSDLARLAGGATGPLRLMPERR